MPGPIPEGSAFFCPHCGALYSVTHSRRSKSESNIAKCVVCQQTMTSEIQPTPRSTSSFTGPKMPNDVPAISARNPSFMDLTEMARISAHT